MQTSWGLVTIDGTVQSLAGAPTKVCKLFMQLAPGCTGQVKVGGSTLTTDNTTPGTVLDSTASTNPDSTKQAGGTWKVETHVDVNTLQTSKYFLIGTHVGDVVFWEVHVN